MHMISLTSSSVSVETGELTKKFPPMPTKRYAACALVTSNALIVAGGQGGFLVRVAVTEVLNRASLQWSTAVDLPQPTFCGSLVQFSDDQIYMVGAYDNGCHPIKSVYTCSLNALLQTCRPQSLTTRLMRYLSQPRKVWRRVADIPAIDSAYVSLHGRLLAIGGKDSDNKLITAVHVYDPSSNLWEVISHMATPRSKCYAAVLPDNQLVVVGGCTSNDYTSRTDSVEIATLFE